jgi:putative oxidoreductase
MIEALHRHSGGFMNEQKDWAAFVGRILLSILFITSGFEKISGFEGTAGFIAGHGLPFPQVLAAGAIAIELGGGLAVLAGWKTRWVALALIIFMIVITPIFHNFWSAPPAQAMNQQINFMKNVSILGGIFLLFAFGPGRYSLDRA